MNEAKKRIVQAEQALTAENNILTQAEQDFRDWKTFQSTVILRTKGEIKKQQDIIRKAEGRLDRLEIQLETLQKQAK